ncbi:ribbon-helix-helix protein, CopG family [Candidatus Mycobacterium methanotrophicum]|uniref:Ribbon-helix-helix domain-containing protein n=1 Tax=Candidatus Mycobacterium methanotrophicum TaxID=2943498 RepID=A0ABY4QF91_9MYCO|nr:ribbon-helix-helix protein, CopG family [Candidatus Mycobacterium methanotrophicum]UQX09650.1 ribbon-helix-helix domain-containing protein [Candidatus Mycobacterium methanotrophicum]
MSGMRVGVAYLVRVGDPINVRLGDDLLSDVDRYAKVNEISRAEAIRQLIYNGLRATDR